MEVVLVFVEGCPNVEVARARIMEAGRRAGVAVDVLDRVVVDEAGAAAAGMRGSPTVLVAGVDVTSLPEAGASLSCRLDVDGRTADVDAIAVALSQSAKGRVDAEGC